jgi:predicted O-methyltransferase YrrM
VSLAIPPIPATLEAWPLATEAIFRILAWPRYDDVEDLDVVLDRYGRIIAGCPDAILCLRHDAQIDGPAENAVQLLTERYDALFPNGTDLNVLLINESIETHDLARLGAAITCAVILPSTAEEARQNFIRGLDTHVLHEPNELMGLLEQALRESSKVRPAASDNQALNGSDSSNLNGNALSADAMDDTLAPEFDDPATRCVLLLKEMYGSTTIEGINGAHEVDEDAHIDVAEGKILWQLTKALRPQHTLEIGFGCGFASLFMLGAMMENGFGTHTSIEHDQRTTWNGAGIRQIERLGAEHMFELLEESPGLALAQMATNDRVSQLIFINGEKNFDSMVMYLHYAIRLLPVGGMIVFNDSTMPSVRAAAEFARENLPVGELPSGLRVDRESISPLTIFVKVAEDERNREHFVSFNATGR